MEMNSSHIHQSMISSIPPWQLKQPISYTRFDSKNKNPFQETFENIKDQYSDYTDGSKDEDLVGSAAIYGSKEYTKRLSRTSSIYTAKLQPLIWHWTLSKMADQTNL